MLLAAEKGELALDLCRLNSRELLAEVRRAYSRHPAAAGREMLVAPDAASFTLVTDRTILGRVMGNLAKNALEASPAGSPVTLSCQAGPSGGTFTCHNSGCMGAEARLQMFQRSFSTKGPGRGIGAYSVKLLTEKYLQGRVSFTSTVQDGTTFAVMLPDSPGRGLASRAPEQFSGLPLADANKRAKAGEDVNALDPAFLP
jgi:signal transduction histidine kinase